MNSRWPWDEPYKVWSLWEMLSAFKAGDFASSFANIERATAMCEIVINSSNLPALQSALVPFRDAVSKTLNLCKSGSVPLSFAVEMQLKRFLEETSWQIVDYAALAAKARAARQAVIDDLSQHLFFCIPHKDRDFYLQPEPPFGTLVDAAFPDAKRDIEAACRCFALNEWTACVFHLMRVLEHGLRKLAAKFNVTFAVDSWHKVIKGIEDGIQALRNKGQLTTQDREEITKCSDAASEFRHFKDAWRNHVSHAREHYDDMDADKVMRSVRSFMDQMVNI